MQRLVTPEQDKILRRERQLLNDLRVLIARLGAPDEDLALLQRAQVQLDELFLLVVVGEFNAGKTAFLNAMLGQRLLAEGVLPTTNTIQVLHYGAEFREEQTGPETVTVYLPVEWLREISLVDTPGTNAVIQRHQEITEHFVPRSDLVLFVTSADRPFSESERAFLERIRQWGKKIVVIVNKIDMIAQPDELAAIVEFVAHNAATLLGTEPQVFAVSARQALQAKLAAVAAGAPVSGAGWEQSQFAPLESYVHDSLDAAARLRLKLENPLGVCRRIADQYGALIDNRRTILRDDFLALDSVEEQLSAYEADMRRDFKYHLSHVENVLYALAERGDRFFDDTLSIWNIFDLINGDKLRAAFEREVVADTSRDVDRYTNELIDWLVDREYRQWRDLTEFMNRRAALHSEQMVGRMDSEFDFSRQKLIASVGSAAQDVVDSYDPRAESAKLLQQVQTALIQTAAVEASALGIGALLVALLHTSLLDFTGVLGASVLAALGLYVLPYRRNRLKIDLRSRVAELRVQLDQAITAQFERELSGSTQRMREAVAPYTRFVRTERDKLEKLAAAMDTAREQLAALRADIARHL